jgi:hypothetical protein
MSLNIRLLRVTPPWQSRLVKEHIYLLYSQCNDEVSIYSYMPNYTEVNLRIMNN